MSNREPRCPTRLAPFLIFQSVSTRPLAFVCITAKEDRRKFAFLFDASAESAEPAEAAEVAYYRARVSELTGKVVVNTKLASAAAAGVGDDSSGKRSLDL